MNPNNQNFYGTLPETDEFDIISNLKEKNPEYVKFTEKQHKKWIALLGSDIAIQDLDFLCVKRSSKLYIFTHNQCGKQITYCLYENIRIVHKETRSSPLIAGPAFIHINNSEFSWFVALLLYFQKTFTI